MRAQGARSVRGGVVIETALLAALLAVVAIVAGDAAAAWRIRTVLSMAAREGARTASLVPNLQPDDPVAMAVMDEVLIGSGVRGSGAGRSVRFAVPLVIGDPVTATATYEFRPTAPGLEAAFGGPIMLRAASDMPYRGSGAAP